MKTLLAIIRLIALLTCLCLFYGTYVFSTIFVKHTVKRGFRLRRNFARTGNWILGIKNTIEGEFTADKPILYVINHRSLIDPMIIAEYVDVFFVSKAEVSSYPVLGPGAQKTGVIFVERDSKSSRSATLDAIEDTFEKNENIGIFPEGTTNLYKLTKQYRMGSFRIAAEMGVPVVPVTLEYRDNKDLWNTNNMIVQFINQFGAWRTHTKIIVGDAMKSDDPVQLLERSQKFTDDNLSRIHEGWTTMEFLGERQPVEVNQK